MFFCIALMLLFVVRSESAMEGAARGLELFMAGVFPSLFPFAVCISCLKRMGGFSFESKPSKGFFKLQRFLIIGAIAGNPTGSFLLSGESKGGLTLTRLGIYSALFNLASPVFIIGTVCTKQLGFATKAPGILLLVCHYTSSLLIFFAFEAYNSLKRNKLHQAENSVRSKKESMFDSQIRRDGIGLVSAFPAAAADAASAMLKLMGTIVFFSTIGTIIEKSGLLSLVHPATAALSMGMLEMTGGLQKLASSAVEMRLQLSLCSFIISFGGICIFMQANSICVVDACSYLCTKLIHGFAAALLCYFLFPVFISGSSEVFASISASVILSRTLTASKIALLCFASSVFASLFAVFAAKRTRA